MPPACHRLLPLTIALAALVPARLAAQRVEVAVTTGLSLPSIEQFTLATAWSPATPSIIGRTEPAWRFGLHLRVWPRRRLGMEGLVSRWSPNRTVALESDPPGYARHGATTLTTFAVRVTWRIGDLRQRHGDLALGAQLTHLAGEGYSSITFSPYPLARRSEWGPSAAAALVQPVNGRLAVRGGVDVFAYRLHLEPVRYMVRRTPLQVELFFNLGVVARVF